MACRTGCPTQDHASWGACAREANMRIAWAASARGLDLTAQKRWDGELDAYASARAAGIQPKSTSLKHTRKAMELSEKSGVAFDAGNPAKHVEALVGA
jgi:hypothetical protein